MSELEETTQDNAVANFKVNGMPLRHFRNFKRLADDYRGNYSITIQVLMDKANTLEYIMAGQEPQIEEVEYEETSNDEVKTLGD